LSSAFLAATIINVIRSNMLESVDLAKPADVLTELNRRFPMEKNNGKYFTIWYGVYNTDSRQLTWAVAGHPSALLAKMTNGPQLTALGSRTFAIGMVEDTTYDADQCVVEPGDRLYLYSDGVVDIHLKTGGVRTSDEFVRFVRAQLSESRDCVLDRVHANANELSATTKFKDDFSILELRL
jgi:sigma-B regulation protein RsbU (phosphoserine phosphatase)